MDVQKLIELLIAGGLAGLIGAAAVAWKTKRDAEREDRKQRADETSGAAATAKTITDAAGIIVKLQDDQVEEFRLQIRALQAESSALNKRLDVEMQKRLRAEARESVIQDQVNQLRDQLAAMGAQFEIADQARQALERENGAMKTKLFEMSVGIQTLTRQLRAANIEPTYTLDVPPVDRTPSGRLGQIDATSMRYSS